MVNSSGALPPESCPWTSVPGLAVRAITSPSIGDRTKNRWVTPPEPRPRNKPARLRARASSADARSYTPWAWSSSRWAAACASTSSRRRFSSRSAAVKSASALPRSESAAPRDLPAGSRRSTPTAAATASRAPHGGIELEHRQPEIVQVLEVLGARLRPDPLRVEELQERRGALLVLHLDEIARAARALEEASAHPLHQPPVGVHRGPRLLDVEQRLRS